GGTQPYTAIVLGKAGALDDLMTHKQVSRLRLPCHRNVAHVDHLTDADGGRRRRLCRNEAVLFWLCAHPAVLFSSVAARAPGVCGRTSDPRVDAVPGGSTRAYRRAHQLPHPGCTHRHDAH